MKEKYGVTGLCLYGSTARGDNNEDSDVDILVDMPPKIFLMSGLKNFFGANTLYISRFSTASFSSVCKIFKSDFTRWHQNTLTGIKNEFS